ncbi:MAG: hypothetical protein MUO40_01120, partial [Anaerolineaceae bacterium]|nr:hypothetical protein [Anaerolineaceae bacterium]
FSTPVYIPLPGKMQNFLNRICPILNPKLRIEEGRTRAILRNDIPINKFGIIATGGWWEIGNLDTIVRVIDEIAKDAGIEFIPPILRPHAFLMRSKGIVTDEGENIMKLLENAGKELIETGTIQAEVLNNIARPLTSFQEFLETQSA